MKSIFESPRRTFARARHHIADFNEHIEAFQKGNPCEGFTEIDSETGKCLHKIRIKEPIPATLNNIAFDVVSNLRASLDQAAYATAIANGKRGKNAQFPFGDSATYVEELNRIGRKCEDIPDEIFKAILQFRPHKGGDDLLWALNKICNSNKHRILSAMMNAASVQKGVVIIPPNGVTVLATAWDSAENEATYAISDPGVNLHATLYVAIHVAFGEPECVANLTAQYVLDEMAGIVSRVLDTLEFEAQRIGLN